MKKIFSIIAACVLVFVVVLVGVLAGCKKDIGFAIPAPEYIYVYNQSTTTTNDGESYEEGNAVYSQILEQLSNMTKSSLLTLALHGDINYKIEYDIEDYSTYDSSMKTGNLVIELIYTEQKDVVVYEDGNSRTLPFMCLLIIIPVTGSYNEIVVYNSLSNNSSTKEEQYATNVPFVLKGSTKSIVKFANSLA